MFRKLISEYDTFNIYAPEKYSSLSPAEQEKLDASIRTMLVDAVGVHHALGGLQHLQLSRRGERVPPDHRSREQVLGSAFSSLFHMDMLPHIPQSTLLELVKYANMECNATPLSLSAISKQIDDYIPLVTTVGDRSDFSQVILKTLFLLAILGSSYKSLSSE